MQNECVRVADGSKCRERIYAFHDIYILRLLKANGDNVIMVNLVNYRGIHICKSMLAWQLYGNGETPESSGMKGDHLVGKYYVEFDKHYKQEVKALMAEKGISEEEAKKCAPVMVAAQEMLRKWERSYSSLLPTTILSKSRRPVPAGIK